MYIGAVLYWGPGKGWDPPYLENYPFVSLRLCYVSKLDSVTRTRMNSPSAKASATGPPALGWAVSVSVQEVCDLRMFSIGDSIITNTILGFLMIFIV